jgi:thiamine biosynthesis lipoprotein
MTLTRCRFLTIPAVTATLPGVLAAAPARHWTSQALGARTSIRLDYPNAAAITARCLAEIDRLENILSLYRANSALSLLDRSGRLDTPPFELLECLSLAGAVHRASGSAFDVKLQPPWAVWARAAVQNRRPTQAERDAALIPGGWTDVALSPRPLSCDPTWR